MVLPTFHLAPKPKWIVFYGPDLFGNWDLGVAHAIAWLMRGYSIVILPGAINHKEMTRRLGSLDIAFPHSRLAVLDLQEKNLAAQVRWVIHCCGADHASQMLLLSLDCEAAEEAARQDMQSFHADHPEQIETICSALQSNRAEKKGSSHYVGGRNTTPHRTEQLAGTDSVSKAVAVVG